MKLKSIIEKNINVYVWGTDEDNFRDEFYLSREEAAQAGMEETCESVYTARKAKYDVCPDYFMEHLEEMIADKMYEEIGYIMEDWNMSDKQIETLKNCINKIANSSFWKAEDVEYHYIEDDDDEDYDDY